MNSLSQISHIRQRIAQLAGEQKAAERVFTGRKKLLKGTVTEVLRTCGKPGCKCSKGDKHLCYQLSASVEGKTRTRNVPRKYLAKVKHLTENYRRFRRARANWIRINTRMLELVNELEATRITSDFRDEFKRQKS